MIKFTQKQIKEFVKNGHAYDLQKMIFPVPGLIEIGYSSGQSGVNGALFRDTSGRLYAITSRCSTLFKYL